MLGDYYIVTDYYFRFKYCNDNKTVRYIVLVSRVVGSPHSFEITYIRRR